MARHADSVISNHTHSEPCFLGVLVWFAGELELEFLRSNHGSRSSIESNIFFLLLSKLLRMLCLGCRWWIEPRWPKDDVGPRLDGAEKKDDGGLVGG